MLIVDDEPGMRRTLSRVMQARGCTIETAEDGLQAVAIATEFRPDCVLMDLRMPQMNGLEALRRIREVCPNAFVVLMTAFSDTGVTSEAREEGAIDVLAKPLDLDALTALVERAADEPPVLVIDDDDAFCRSLHRILTSQGFNVEVSLSVEDALRRFQRRPRGIVLLDMHLDGRSGLDVMQELRRQNPEIAVILISGHDEMCEQMRAAVGRGAASWLTKPLDIDRLLATIGTTP
ncbi:MAG: response regulator [Planctomycetaceae bacterium]|nr:response regulator [Planctomycetaceae bacterium]